MPASALAGLSFLIIGSSHLATPTYLIGSLHDRLLDDGAKQVHTIGVCGAQPSDWLKVTPGTCGRGDRLGREPATRVDDGVSTTPIKELLAQEKPDALVIVMGDTIATYKSPTMDTAYIDKEVKPLVQAAGEAGVACYWVSPGWGGEGGRYGRTFARVKEFSEYLPKVAAPCKVIDSTKFSQPGEWKTIDGQHYLKSGYKLWGDAIANEIASMPPVKTAQ